MGQLSHTFRNSIVQQSRLFGNRHFASFPADLLYALSTVIVILSVHPWSLAGILFWVLRSSLSDAHLWTRACVGFSPEMTTLDENAEAKLPPHSIVLSVLWTGCGQ